MAGTMAGSDQVRILIADAAELVRRGIRDVLARDARFDVIGELTKPEDVPAAAARLAPDIVLLGLGHEPDAHTASSADLAALWETFRRHPLARVIVFVEGDGAEDALGPVRAGAQGVLVRDASAETVLDAIRDVLDGGAALDPRLARSLFDHLAAGAAPALAGARELDPGVLGLLSRREQEVLRALAQGYRNKEISAELGVSVGTVKTHLRHIFRKLKVADRTAAVLVALQARLPKAA